ncbi:hypothetical protein HYT58_00705 [Candidatus Woesearchaeota archaeon]|nr:hypothetical protein [Candidatus Woesearchaeota archaeon]
MSLNLYRSLKSYLLAAAALVSLSVTGCENPTEEVRADGTVVRMSKICYFPGNGIHDLVVAEKNKKGQFEVKAYLDYSMMTDNSPADGQKVPVGTLDKVEGLSVLGDDLYVELADGKVARFRLTGDKFVPR